MQSMTCRNFTDKYKHQTTAHHAKTVDMNTYKTVHDAKTVEIHINPIINNTIYFIHLLSHYTALKFCWNHYQKIK